MQVASDLTMAKELIDIKVDIYRHCPEGWIVNGKTINCIARALKRTDGICPCAHDEWDETVSDDDRRCPCVSFRTKRECHCGLYRRDEE